MCQTTLSKTGIIEQHQSRAHRIAQRSSLTALQQPKKKSKRRVTVTLGGGAGAGARPVGEVVLTCGVLTRAYAFGISL